VSVDGDQETITVEQLAAVATTLVGTVGGVVSAHAGVVALATADCADVMLALSVAETL